MKKKGLAAIIGGGIVALAGVAGIILGVKKNKTDCIACNDDPEAIENDPDFEVVDPDDEEQ